MYCRVALSFCRVFVNIGLGIVYNEVHTGSTSVRTLDALIKKTDFRQDNKYQAHEGSSSFVVDLISDTSLF